MLVKRFSLWNIKGVKDILEQLRHVDGIPSFLRSMETDRIALAQCIANAADEIERLRNEVKELKKPLKEMSDSAKRRDLLLKISKETLG